MMKTGFQSSFYFLVLFVLGCGNPEPKEFANHNLKEQKEFVAQKHKWWESDSVLTSAYKKMVDANGGLGDDSLATYFKRLLLTKLSNPLTFDDKFDSLSECINIQTSADKRIKFYSWDDHTGGTWHSLVSLVQFRSGRGKIIIKELNSELEADGRYFGACAIYKVNVIRMGQDSFYLIFGWGTLGDGNQHQLIQLYQFQDDKLIQCQSCFNKKSNIVIEYSRAKKLDLAFDTTTNEISYKEFEQDPSTSFHKETGKIVKLKFKNGKFLSN